MLRKSIFVLVTLIVVSSCTKAVPKDYAALSGEIKNAKTQQIIIKGRDGYLKKITLASNGAFSDTLHLKDTGQLLIFSINDTGQLFLKNDDDVTLTLDANNFKESISFKGKGAGTSNYLAKKLALQSKFMVVDLFDLDKNTFKSKVKEISIAFNGLLDKYNKIDTAFLAKEKLAIKALPEMLDKQYNQIQSLKNKYANLEGKPSPEFNNYENNNGDKVSLKDFKGNYIYIDVWATWCRPCLGEIPYLQKLEEEFRGENIQFISISIDRETSKSNWKKMVKEKNMGGIQLFARKNDSFKKAYKINSIPRFILIDPNGIVIDANMSRPSSPKTKEQLTKLLN